MAYTRARKSSRSRSAKRSSGGARRGTRRASTGRRAAAQTVRIELVTNAMPSASPASIVQAADAGLRRARH